MDGPPPADARRGPRFAGVASAPAWARAYASPRTRASAAVSLVGASAAGFAVLLAQGQLGPPVTIPARELPARVAILAIGLGTLFAYGGMLGSAIALPLWTHRCWRNLPALGSRGRLSPAWAAATWLIPLVNLVLPALVLRDLASASPRGRWLIGAWWVAWLMGFLLWIGIGMVPARWLDVAVPLYRGLLATAGLLLAVVVWLVTLLQDRRAAAIQV